MACRFRGPRGRRAGRPGKPGRRRRKTGGDGRAEPRGGRGGGTSGEHFHGGDYGMDSGKAVALDGLRGNLGLKSCAVIFSPLGGGRIYCVLREEYGGVGATKLRGQGRSQV